MKYNKPLFFFDFDDTLIKSGNCQIIIKKPNGTSYVMDPHSFYDYVLKNGETADYGLFNDDIVNPVIIEQIWNIFLNRIETYGVQSVSILTARDNPKPVESFLESKGIKQIIVNAVGVYNAQFNTTAINALNKKNHIQKMIHENPECDYVEFYDDNKLNILRVQELRELFPNVKIKTVLVKH